ncbi:MAG: hypothetical protein ACQETF_08085 [Bacteroidota bacterium]
MTYSNLTAYPTGFGGFLSAFNLNKLLTLSGLSLRVQKNERSAPDAYRSNTRLKDI